jgi:ubiquinone/menaquinone biosynthesis C-methylase UbiE
MIAQARALNRHGDRVAYLEGKADSLPCADATYDFVFSKIVLQHLPVDLQKVYVREFVRVLKPRGIAAFQTPSRALVDEGTQFRSPIETPAGTATIDMNTFPRADVERTLRDAGATLLHALPDASAGEKFESFLYIATR